MEEGGGGGGWGWDESCVLPLLDVLLTKMREVYHLSYDSDVEPLANELVQANPSGAWGIIKARWYTPINYIYHATDRTASIQKGR